ncbi:MAG TPA: hypothetical protein VEC12_08595 [Bacteroidia bacterium]|nr:hypothetical protein [Bacteroidia bacterium]
MGNSKEIEVRQGFGMEYPDIPIQAKKPIKNKVRKTKRLKPKDNE